jgi:protein-cysteine N-palmitoyltransferase HHAT
MLRLVSFGMDYHWSLTNVLSSDVSEQQFSYLLIRLYAILSISLEQTRPSSMSEKQRTALSHPHEMYSFTNYLAYVLYPPLYIAGPIMTFNDFLWQVSS